MFETLFQFIALLAVIVGTFFSILGVIGLIRLPDVYTRLHATGKVGLFGVVLLLIGDVVLTPLGLSKGLVLIALLMIGGPATSHALASAAYRSGIPMQNAIRDDLARVARGEEPEAPGLEASQSNTQSGAGEPGP
jgi:multicomponent Na+:H+ antiporter subunit G